MNDRLILGIDGGGTKTAVSIARLDKDNHLSVLSKALAGASNISSMGQEKAFSNLDAALTEAIKAADTPLNKIDFAVLGLAGISAPEMRALILKWIEARKLPSSSLLVSDIDPVMMAGTPDNWGVALIVGTGSIAKGLNQAGDTATLGGWGHWYGDQGSAYDLGHQALIACVKAVDDLAPKTALLEKILSTLEVTKAEDIIVALQHRGDVHAEIAGLAKFVTQLAEQGDSVAERILEDAVGEMVSLCLALSKRLNFPPSFPIAMAGGVICNSDFYRESFEAALLKNDLGGTQLKLVSHPVDGCLALARHELLKQN